MAGRKQSWRFLNLFADLMIVDYQGSGPCRERNEPFSVGFLDMERTGPYFGLILKYIAGKIFESLCPERCAKKKQKQPKEYLPELNSHKPLCLSQENSRSNLA